MASDLRHGEFETLGIADGSLAVVLAVVVAETCSSTYLLKMKRLHSNVGSLKAALQKRPEVFHAVHMNATANVRLSLVHIVRMKRRCSPFS
jgi:hypothetical protein